MTNETKLEALLAEIGEQYIAHYSIHGDPSIWVGVEIPDYKKCGTATQWIKRFKVCDMATDGPEYGRVRTELFVAALNELPQLLADLAAEKARADALQRVIEIDRSRVCEMTVALRKTVASRAWLEDSNGPYAFDDPRLRDEFAQGVQEIRNAVEQLNIVAQSIKDCPIDDATVRECRIVAHKANVESLKRLDAQDGEG